MNDKTNEAESAVTLEKSRAMMAEMQRRYEQAEKYIASLTQMNNNYATALNRAETELKRVNDELEKLRSVKARAAEIAELKDEILALTKLLEVANRKIALGKEVMLKYDDIIRTMLDN